MSYEMYFPLKLRISLLKQSKDPVTLAQHNTANFLSIGALVEKHV